MRFTHFALGTILVAGLAASAGAQTTLTLAWKNQADSVDYMTSASNGARGLALNRSAGGSLLIASTDGGQNALRRLDPATGALRTPNIVPNTGYSTTGVNRAINKVVVDDAGVIYVCSLSLVGATNVFTIYRHANESSAPTVAFTQTNLAERLGDDMAITGTGVNTKILVASSQPHVSLFTTTDGVTFTRTPLTFSPTYSSTSAAHIDWDPTVANRFWNRSASGLPGNAFDISGATATAAASTPLPTNTAAPAYGPFRVANYNGTKYLFLGIGASTATTTGKTANVYDITDPNTVKYIMTNTNYSGGAAANGNASGDVDVDSTTGKVYVLYTNNSISAFSLPGSGVNEWSLY